MTPHPLSPTASITMLSVKAKQVAARPRPKEISAGAMAVTLQASFANLKRTEVMAHSPFLTGTYTAA